MRESEGAALRLLILTLLALVFIVELCMLIVYLFGVIFR